MRLINKMCLPMFVFITHGIIRNSNNIYKVLGEDVFSSYTYHSNKITSISSADKKDDYIRLIMNAEFHDFHDHAESSRQFYNTWKPYSAEKTDDGLKINFNGTEILLGDEDVVRLINLLMMSLLKYAEYYTDNEKHQYKVDPLVKTIDGKTCIIDVASYDSFGSWDDIKKLDLNTCRFYFTIQGFGNLEKTQSIQGLIEDAQTQFRAIEDEFKRKSEENKPSDTDNIIFKEDKKRKQELLNQYKKNDERRVKFNLLSQVAFKIGNTPLEVRKLDSQEPPSIYEKSVILEGIGSLDKTDQPQDYVADFNIDELYALVIGYDKSNPKTSTHTQYRIVRDYLVYEYKYVVRYTYHFDGKKFNIVKTALRVIDKTQPSAMG